MKTYCNVKIVVIIYLLIARITFVNASLLCNERKNFYQQTKEKLSDIIDAKVVQNVDLVFIGEEHNNYPSETYPIIINSLKKNKFKPDCIFLEYELSKDEQDVLDRYNISFNNIDELNEVLPSFISILFPYFAKNKLKVFGIDKDVEHSTMLEWLNGRDRVMGEKIKKYFSSKTCKKAIMPIGLYHIISGVQDRITIIDRLSNTAIKTESIGLSIQGTMQRNRISSLWSQYDRFLKLDELDSIDPQNFICLNGPRISKKNYALRSFNFDFPILFDSYDKKLIGSISDMRYWFFFTCKKMDCIRKNKVITTNFEKIGIQFY